MLICYILNCRYFTECPSCSIPFNKNTVYSGLESLISFLGELLEEKEQINKNNSELTYGALQGPTQQEHSWHSFLSVLRYHFNNLSFYEDLQGL